MPKNHSKAQSYQNICLLLAYDGTDFYGFQMQPKMRTVQQQLEDAIAGLYGYHIRINGAGRTDAGAHATGQAVNFIAPVKLPVEKLPQALNAKLPTDIRVWKAKEVPLDFHSRYSARGKRYTYTIDNAPIYRVLERHYSWHYPGQLDLSKMNQGAEIIQGTHDFRYFQATGSNVEDTVRTLWRVEVRNDSRDNFIRLTYAGDGFLYKMVRFITGALVWMGKGSMAPEDLFTYIQNISNGEMKREFPALPAHGLCLEEVYYYGKDLP